MRLVPLALARGKAYRALDRPLALAFARPDFRIVHIALVRARGSNVLGARARRGLGPFTAAAAAFGNSVAFDGSVAPARHASSSASTRSTWVSNARASNTRAAWRLELVVEADDQHALARGMQGFQVSAAKTLNRGARRRGTVFPDRYRMQILATRVAVRSLVGSLPLARTDAWPETWLVRIEMPVRLFRRWIHSRADEDS